ncbi:hypothetical protein ACLOJK_009230 [Asimina triloba]
MQRGRSGRGDFFEFGDPFTDFGFGSHRSLMSGFFGRDPFDDPFFNRPFGSMFGPSMLGPSIFDRPAPGFTQHEVRQPKKSSGLIIEELLSDDEDDEHKRSKDEKGAPRKHSGPSKGPFVQHADEETEAYYTSSITRRTGSDGLTVEESKEADTTTGRASHRVSRGIGNKGHSVMRKLDSDGKVDTMQTLHNLNEDELDRFEESWKGKSKKHPPGWNHEFDMLSHGHARATGNSQEGESSQGWALPSADMRSHGHVNAKAAAAFRRA